MALGGNLEENILTALVHSEILAPHIALYIRPSDFSVAVYRRIAVAGLNYLERYQQPAKAHIADMLEEEIRRGPNGRVIVEILEQMQRLSIQLNEDYVRDSLDRFIDVQRLTNAVNKASDLLYAGDLEQAREALRVPDLQSPKDIPGVWLSDTESWLSSFLRQDREVELFSSGIEVLDDKDVRPRRGELYAFMGASGTGKSWFLINVGRVNVIGQPRILPKRVLHITLENSLEVTLQRYTQCFLQLTRDQEERLDVHIFEDRDNPDRVHRERISRLYGGIKSLNYGELESGLEKVQKKGGELLVKHFPTGSLTMGMLNAFLDTLEGAENFKPDLILLDYMTMMSLGNRDARDLRTAVGLLARNLRAMAQIRNCAVVTALQANRQAAGKRQVWGSMISEDWSTHGTCDTFLTYSQTPAEHKSGVARILVDKSRNSDDKFLCFIEQAYAIGQFCYSSAYMTNQLAERLAQDAGEAEE